MNIVHELVVIKKQKIIGNNYISGFYNAILVMFCQKWLSSKYESLMHDIRIIMHVHGEEKYNKRVILEATKLA